MVTPSRIKQFLYLDTYGWLAVSSLLICGITGVLLVVPFDVQQPYHSVAGFIITNPAANFARNLHFWSAQAFLVFSILHVYDHLKRSTEINIQKKSTWLRLILSLAFIGYVMISGFILKADPDSLQARRILTSMLKSIPYAGKLLSSTFIGPEGSWQILYLQHAATATIILFLAIYEHARTVWVKWKTFLLSLLFLVAVSWMFRAPLGSTTDPVMKGPWYFIGLQEAFHWVSKPGWIMMLILLILLLFLLIPYLSQFARTTIKRFLLLVSILYILLTITGYFFRGENWAWQWPWKEGAVIRTAFSYRPVKLSGQVDKTVPLVMGQPEACLTCHHGMKGLSLSHSESNAGCFSCHRGDPFSLDKNQAHKGMELVPGNLSNAALTCGTQNCHPGIVERVNLNLMTTNSGIIQVDRYVFEETNDLNGHARIQDLGNSPADRHLKNLCSGCHLGAEKTTTGPPGWLQRGGGCNACHLTYRQEALREWKKGRDQIKPRADLPVFHPSIDLSISNQKCKSCHSRSGRISMNYEGWNETPLNVMPGGSKDKYQQLPDGRVFEYIKADIHHEKGLSCIDCHNSTELMGDGKSYSHKEEGVMVQCVDCHPVDKAVNGIHLRSTDKETQLTSWLRGYQPGESKMVITAKGGIPLLNTMISEDGDVGFETKLTKRRFTSKKQSQSCSKGSAHSRLSCEACHTSWAPQCIGCHNSYEKNAAGFDMLTKKSVKGAWVEYAGITFAEAPTLGVDLQKNRIITFVPGMILTIDKGSYAGKQETLFHRLYAPAAAHTTRREARICKSCHNDPLALGFGRGLLNYSSDGQWIFEPRFESNSHDGLPEDAWTGFLKERIGNNSTREGKRPFTSAEQKKILRVGACLTCHESSSLLMQSSLSNFEQLLINRSKYCIVPKW